MSALIKGSRYDITIILQATQDLQKLKTRLSAVQSQIHCTTVWKEIIFDIVQNLSVYKRCLTQILFRCFFRSVTCRQGLS